LVKPFESWALIGNHRTELRSRSPCFNNKAAKLIYKPPQSQVQQHNPVQDDLLSCKREKCLRSAEAMSAQSKSADVAPHNRTTKRHRPREHGERKFNSTIAENQAKQMTTVGEAACGTPRVQR
jgi:hypothetical protein